MGKDFCNHYSLITEKWAWLHEASSAQDQLNWSSGCKLALPAIDISMKKFSPDVITRRLAHLPNPVYAEDLPVNARREEIKRAIEQHQVVIICGEIGSNKTTKIPKICFGIELS